MLNSLHIEGAPAQTRIVVAMSGGVDSSVTAALLKDQGYDVVGITLQLYDHGAATHRKGACCAGQDIHDARKVADDLDIPHYVLDYEDRFSASVMDAFADGYLAGETPVPCITCNQQIKFTGLLDTARELGAQALATGHYVRSMPGVDGNGFELYRALDKARDQSYFLFATTRDQLSFLRFPLGGMPKAQVRDLAGKYGLKVAQKSDSQDICFVPAGRYASVIEKLRPDAVQPGDIMHLDGRRLGRHNGILNFTIGQRRGLGIALGDPLYVVKLDAARRQVIVGPRDALRARHMVLRDVNWLGEGDIAAVSTQGLDIFAQIRSTSAPKRALLMNRDGDISVRLHEGEDGISPGQACVFYSSDADDARILGGGWIARVDGPKPLRHRLKNNGHDQPGDFYEAPQIE